MTEAKPTDPALAELLAAGPISDDERFGDGGAATSEGARWDQESVTRAIDDLFVAARRYRTSKEFKSLVAFVRRFRKYAPFNAMLLHVQMPGASFVAPAGRWKSTYGRQVSVTGRPLVILQPQGPVMFVFDVSDTVPIEGAVEIPLEVLQPFETRHGDAEGVLQQTISNAARDGVKVYVSKEGSQSAGSIRPAIPGRTMEYVTRLRPERVTELVPVRYELILNSGLSPAAQYATLVHELAHLFCGHLGSPGKKFWPSRRGLDHAIREFEAEAVSHLVCQRLDIDSPSDRYMSSYLHAQERLPEISLELVMKVAGEIERMGKERLPLRKP
jgi:hypothetical protein